METDAQFVLDARFAAESKGSLDAASSLTWQRLSPSHLACVPAPAEMHTQLQTCSMIIATDVLYSSADMHAVLRCMAALLAECAAGTACVLGYEQRSANKSLRGLLQAYSLTATCMLPSDTCMEMAGQALERLRVAGAAASNSHVEDVVVLEIRLADGPE